MKKILLFGLGLFLSFGLLGCENGLSLTNDDECDTTVKSTDPNCQNPTEDLHIYAGTYIVGTDIDVGVYYFQTQGGDATVNRLDASDNVIGTVTIETYSYIEVKSTDAKIEVVNGRLLPVAEHDNYYYNGTTNVNQGGYMVGDEIPAGDYVFKTLGETTATLYILSSFDLETGSIVTTYTVEDGVALDITIPNTAYGFLIVDGYITTDNTQ